MAAADPKAVDIPVDEHDRVERLLADFDRDWTDGQFAARMADLPLVGHPLGASALLGLLRIEIERQWQSGGAAKLESYLERWPELGTADSVPVSLIVQEYRERQRCGTAPDLNDFARRFPRQAEELRQLAAGESQGKAASSEPEARSASGSGVRAPCMGVLSPRVSSPAFLSPSAPVTSDVGSSPKDTEGPTLPEQFDRYRILKKLGQGGMGAVYLAHDSKLDRRVALKVPKFVPGSDPESLERFYREARATATIHHPNLCPLHDVGEFNGIPFLTMAYIEGWPLSHFVRPDKRLPQSGTAALVRTVALAVAEAHKLGIIHRDLKPGNILVDKRGQPIVMDFGLARWVNADKDDVRFTKNGSILGAPIYMSPEQVYGDVENMGPACDVYSLGVILYELLTGRLPFEGGTTAVLAKTLMQNPTPPSQYRPDLDPRLEAICLKAMAKQSHERFGSMSEMATALADFVKAEKAEREGGGSDTGLANSGTGKSSPGSSDSAARAAEPPPALVTPRSGLTSDSSSQNRAPGSVSRRDSERPTPAPSGRETVVQGPPSDIKKTSPKGYIPTSEHDTSALADPSMSLVRRVSPKPPPQLKRIRQTRKKGWLIAGGVAVLLALAGLLTWFLWPVPPTATLQVRLHPDDADVSVELDNRVLDKNLLAAPMELNPGAHTLVVTGKAFERFERKFTVDQGDNQPIDVELTAKTIVKPQPAPIMPPPPERIGAQQFRDFVGHGDAIESVVFTPDGKRALSASWDKTVRVWDVPTGKEVARLNEHKNKVHAVAVSKDGKRALSGGYDSQIFLWSLEGLKPPPTNNKPIKSLTGHMKEVQSVAFSPSGKRAVSGGSDNVVIVWDLDKGTVLKRCEGHTAPVWAVVFLPDDKQVLSASYDKTIRKWDATTGKQVGVNWQAPNVDIVHALAVSPDGKLALSGGKDKAVHLWDVASGKLNFSFKGHTDTVAGVAFSADGKWALSGSDDKTARLWDIQKRREMDRFTRSTASVLSVAFAPDGKTALLGGRDKIVHQWTLPAR